MHDHPGFARHDHTVCIHTAMAEVEDRCTRENLNLTPVRRRVMQLLLQEHRAMGAYDILERLRAEGLGSQPPVAYRALEFLTANGFAHRVERLNAFVACLSPADDHVPTILICTGCNLVSETRSTSVMGAVRTVGAEAGFDVRAVAVEAEGLCATCRSGASA